MKISNTSIPGVLILEPKVYSDSRGFFLESFNQKKFKEAIGQNIKFVQDNHSSSSKGVLRGLHFQIKHPQGKLVRVVQGEVFDVVVDIRRQSPTFGEWMGVNLSASNFLQIWIPPGLAHGFLVLSETAQLLYKTTDYWHPAYEKTLIWNDSSLAIEWPLDTQPIVSEKDSCGNSLEEIQILD